MLQKLVMPKQTGQLDSFYASLMIYYNAYMHGDPFCDNYVYKQMMLHNVPHLATGAQDGAYLVKQSEITRYFGLVNYDYENRHGHITPRGIEFIKAYQVNNHDKQVDLIFDSIFNDSFGRNNTAIKSSNSDIDPPKLFIKAMFDLNGLTRKDLAYLLYVTHDKQISYNDAIIEFKTSLPDREIIIPQALSNKYGDVKFTVFLKLMGICKEENNKYFLTTKIKNKYGNQIKKLTIYNKTPDIIYSLQEDYKITENDTNEDISNQVIIQSYAYDIKSDKFNKQNNRTPVFIDTSHGYKYKTNPRLSKTALLLSNYKCQWDNHHETFIAKTGQPYMEAHHLVPMHAQKDFSCNLDRIENIVCLCPTCHSAIHLGQESVRLEYLHKLYAIKEHDLSEVDINISFGELFARYYK